MIRRENLPGRKPVQAGNNERKRVESINAGANALASSSRSWPANFVASAGKKPVASFFMNPRG